MVQFKSCDDIAVHLPDLEKARAFYGGARGFKLVREGEDHLTFDTGLLRLHINRDDTPMTFVPALEVDDFEAATAYLTSHGCRIVREWPQFKALYFEDPFGFVIDIIQR